MRRTPDDSLVLQVLDKQNTPLDSVCNLALNEIDIYGKFAYFVTYLQISIQQVIGYIILYTSAYINHNFPSFVTYCILSEKIRNYNENFLFSEKNGIHTFSICSTA